ncbi:MAG: TolC family protein [Desulfovibrio desulfuricans]|jgi:outer membrane protein|nr:TolC family protein [Desulfovibrio desulfuricans]
MNIVARRRRTLYGGLVCALLGLALLAAPAWSREARTVAPLHSGRTLSAKPLPPPSGAVSMPDAVERALRSNPSLGSQEAQQEASEAARKSARGAFGPRLGMSYSAIKQKRDTSPESTASRTPERGTYSWAVEVSQPVFQGFRLLAAYQRAALQAESDRAAVRKAELDMTESVQTEFLNYLRYEESARSQRDSLARLQDQLRITTAFYRVGLRPRLDVLQAEVDVRKAENTLIQAENSRDTSRAKLNTLMGLPAAAHVDYAGKLAYVPFRRSLEQCLEAAYRQRPDLHMAALSVDISRKSQKEVQAGYYPQVEAYWNMTQTGNTPDLQAEGELGSRTQTWEVGARATWEAFQWGTTYYADKEAGSLVTKMRYAQEDLKLTVGYEIKSKLLAVREAAKRIHVSEKGVEQATEAYKVAQARYREQVGTNFDVLDASAKLAVAEAELTGARADYLTALAQLYVAMGEYRPDLTRP